MYFYRELLIKWMKKRKFNRIKAILAEEDTTNKDLASQLHVAEPTVSRWCTNRQQPSLETLYEIAGVLKRDVRDFLTADGPPPPPWSSKH